MWLRHGARLRSMRRSRSDLSARHQNETSHAIKQPRAVERFQYEPILPRALGPEGNIEADPAPDTEPAQGSTGMRMAGTIGPPGDADHLGSASTVRQPRVAPDPLPYDAMVRDVRV